MSEVGQLSIPFHHEVPVGEVRVNDIVFYLSDRGYRFGRVTAVDSRQVFVVPNTPEAAFKKTGRARSTGRRAIQRVFRPEV